MTLYFESSALAKLLRPEPGSDIARSEFATAEVRATSVIAYPELCATIAAWYPRPVPGRAAARREVDAAWPLLNVLRLDDAGARRAGELALRHRLRGMDAIHIAAALDLAAATEGRLVFISWDSDQREVAQREGLRLLPETL